MSQRQLSDLNISQANKILCRKHLNSSIYILNYINKIRRYLKTYIYGQYTPNPSLSIVAHIPNSTGYSSARLPDEANLHYLEKGIPDTLTLILGRGFLKWCHALQDRRWSIISDVICFEVWRVHVKICNRPAFMAGKEHKYRRSIGSGSFW